MIFTHVNPVVRNSRIKVSVSNTIIKQFSVFVQIVHAWDGQEGVGHMRIIPFPPTKEIKFLV